jgi:hypothetical protein
MTKKEIFEKILTDVMPSLILNHSELDMIVARIEFANTNKQSHC